MEPKYRFFRNGKLLFEYTETELKNEIPGWDGTLDLGDSFNIGEEVVRVIEITERYDENSEIKDFHVRGIQESIYK